MLKLKSVLIVFYRTQSFLTHKRLKYIEYSMYLIVLIPYIQWEYYIL